MEGEKTAQQGIPSDSDGINKPTSSEYIQQEALPAVEGSSLHASASGALQDDPDISQEAAEGEAQEQLAAKYVGKPDQAAQEQSGALDTTEVIATPGMQAEPDGNSSEPEVQQQSDNATASTELSAADKNSAGHDSEVETAAAAPNKQAASGQQSAAHVLAGGDDSAEQTAAAKLDAQLTSPIMTADAAAPVQPDEHATELIASNHATTTSKPATAQLIKSEKPLDQAPIGHPPAVAQAMVATETTAGNLNETNVAIKPHKETAAERLTAPTAMRMLKTLQQTQGNKAEWHIATGVVFKSKKLNADEMSAMVDRLCVAEHADDNLPAKLHAVKLVYVDNKETYEPVKEVTKEENISYMSELYSRCQETRSKTQHQLAERYLQPLIKPREKASSSPDKA